MIHSWDWHIYLHKWLIFMANVGTGKYTIHGSYGVAYPIPKTNIFAPENGPKHPKRDSLPIIQGFRGKLAVSFREGNPYITSIK